MFSLYENIKRLCAEKGVSPSRMCEDIGRSKSLMTALRSGKTTGINYESAELMAKYFGVSVDEVLHGQAKKDPSTMTDAEARDELTRYLIMLRDRPDLLELLDAAQGLEPEDVKDVTNIAAKLGGKR